MAMVTLPPLPNLTNLTIGEMHHCYCKLQDSPNLTNLTIKKIFSAAWFELPKSLPHLTSFIIEGIEPAKKRNFDLDIIKIKLPDSLYSLTRLSINGHNAILIPPSKPDGIKNFIIETGHDEVTRKLLYEINGIINII